jgi:hypothetical protein
LKLDVSFVDRNSCWLAMTILMVEAGPVSFVFSFDFVFLSFSIQIKLHFKLKKKLFRLSFYSAKGTKKKQILG